MQATIHSLQEKGIHIEIVKAIQLQLYGFLKLGSNPMVTFSTCVREAILHQNIIGWRQFLCGYVSTKWNHAQMLLKESYGAKEIQCGRILIHEALTLHQSIWKDQSDIIKGITYEDQQRKERETI